MARLVPEKDLKEVVRLRDEEGWTFTQIGEKYGLTKEAAAHRYRLAGKDNWVTKVCDLFECSVKFKTRNIQRRYCCRPHTKRGSERERLGLKAKLMRCALPECDKGIWSVSGEKQIRAHRRFCSKNHSSIHYQRIKRGVYDRIEGKSKLICRVPGCGERIVLDEHHIEFTKAKSNKKGPSIWLCPTHHMALHRGVAVINLAGAFVSLVPKIRKALKRQMN